MKLIPAALALWVVGTVLSYGFTRPLQAKGPGYDGVVQPHRILDLGGASDGLIESVLVDRGSRVEAGDLIATLDVRVTAALADLSRARSQQGAAIGMARSRVTDARRRLAVQETLLADGFTPPESADLVRAEVELEELALAEQEEEHAIALLELRRAEAVLAQARITSPLSGLVVDRHLSPGEFYSRTGQKPVVTLAELDPLVVEVHLPVEKFQRIQIGDEARIRLDTVGSPMRTALVETKDHMVDTASRTFRVRLHLPNQDYEFPAGLRCRVIFGD